MQKGVQRGSKVDPLLQPKMRGKAQIEADEGQETVLDGGEAPNFKGWSWANGYKYLFMPKHPMASKAGLVAEHRLVMAQAIGRMLLPTEVVHHKNRKHADNRLENLTLEKSHQEHIRNHWKMETVICPKCHHVLGVGRVEKS